MSNKKNVTPSLKESVIDYFYYRVSVWETDFYSEWYPDPQHHLGVCYKCGSLGLTKNDYNIIHILPHPQVVCIVRSTDLDER